MLELFSNCFSLGNFFLIFKKFVFILQSTACDIFKIWTNFKVWNYINSVDYHLPHSLNGYHVQHYFETWMVLSSGNHLISELRYCTFSYSLITAVLIEFFFLLNIELINLENLPQTLLAPILCYFPIVNLLK